MNTVLVDVMLSVMFYESAVRILFLFVKCMSIWCLLQFYAMGKFYNMQHSRPTPHITGSFYDV